MKLIDVLKSGFKTTVLFVSIATVFALPGLFRCSSSVDVPDGQSTAQIVHIDTA